jgi:hypothetical protein
MAENYRNGLVWHRCMQNPEIIAAMEAAGLRRSDPGWRGPVIE